MLFRACLLALATSLFASAALAARVEILEGENYDLIASTSRGLRLRFEEPDMLFRVGGRIHADGAFFDDDETQLGTDGRLRRARLYLSGRIEDVFRFKIEREFAPERGEFRNLWVQYKPNGRVGFKVGNFVAPFGLEQVQSSNFSTFMERSMSGTLAPSFQTGARIDLNGRLTDRKSRHRWTWALAGGFEPMGQRSDDSHRSEHWSVVTRATWAPIARRRTVVHFGGAGEFRDVLGDDTYSISTRTESSLGPRILDTGTLADVDTVASAGAEAAALFGPVLLQGEYHHSFLQRTGGRDDVSVGGGYGQISWVVTGESRNYSRSTGVFSGLDPRSDWGAVELAARFSTLDLEDGIVDGGEATNVSVGANWYIRSNLRLMFNYVRVDGKQEDSGASDDPQIFQFRAQLHF
jgi:phosphate-selective porin OprO/OprP